MSGRKTSVPFFEICTVIGSAGLIFAYHDFFFTRIDSILYALSGKSLSGRSTAVHGAFFIALFLLLSLSVILAERLVLHRIWNTKIYTALLLLLLAIPGIQMLILCANQILRRDDYWEIADAHSYGFPGSMIFEVTHHNGRYLSWGIKSAYAFLPPIPSVNILLVLNIALLTAGFYLLIMELLRHTQGTDSRILPLTCAAAMTCMVILLSSNIWEVWFWGSGTPVYGLSISLCIISFALVLRISGGTSRKLPEKILAGICCFLGCGGSELSTVSLAAFLFMLLIWKRITLKKLDRTVLLYFCEVVLCCLGILLLSGSINAAGEFAAAPEGRAGGALTSLPAMIISAGHSLWRYALINRKILLIFLFIFVIIGTQCPLQPDMRKKCVLIALLLLLTAHPVLLLNVVIDYMPSRVVTVPLCWVFSGLALLCFSAGSSAAGTFRADRTQQILFTASLLIAFSFTVFFAENIEEVRQIRRTWLVRDVSLQNVFDQESPVTTCSIPTLGSAHDDLEADPQELYNIAMRMYYRVPAVTAPTRCPPFGDN